MSIALLKAELVASCGTHLFWYVSRPSRKVKFSAVPQEEIEMKMKSICFGWVSEYVFLCVCVYITESGRRPHAIAS